MGLFAAIVGALGGLSAIAGILNVVDVIPNDIGIAIVDWTFWFFMAALFILGSIAISVANKFSGD